MAIRKHSEHKLTWCPTPLSLRPSKHSWSEDGKMYGELVFQLFYDVPNGSIYLKDVMDDVSYKISSGQRSKGYTIAMKLMTQYLKN